MTWPIDKTIINMSHNINLSVIAEGAENDDHIEFLKANHCNEVRGFYYSLPLPVDELVEYYKQYVNNEKIARNQQSSQTRLFK